MYLPDGVVYSYACNIYLESLEHNDLALRLFLVADAYTLNFPFLGSGDGTCHIWRAIVSKPEEVRESFTNNHIRQVLKHWLEGTLKAKPF